MPDTAASLLALFLAVRAAAGPGAPLPELTLPAPTGAEAVGTLALDLAMPEREEVFTARAGDRRRIALQVWYPAAAPGAGCERVPYMDARVARTGDLPAGWEAHVRSHACRGAAASSRSGRRPVILFSHGLGGTRFGYTSLYEDLASRGYVVVALHHTYGSLMTVFADGTAAPWDDHRWQEADEAKLLRNVERNVEEWVADARAVLDLLARIDRADLGGAASGDERAVAARLAGRLDLDRIGYAGHSYGGSTAVLTSLRDPRIRAVANLDGRVRAPIPIPVRPPVPLLVLLNEQSPGRRDFDVKPGDVLARVAGTTHSSFSDSPLLRKTFGATAETPQGRPAPRHPLDPVAAIALTRAALAGFFDCTLRGEPDRCASLPQDLARAAVKEP